MAGTKNAAKWPMVKLGEILFPAGEPERITDTSKEKFVTLKLHGQGAVERQVGIGKTPRPFSGFRISSGQFIYSRIDARNGAFAIVPPDLDGAVVSKDFPVFEISENIDHRYLAHLGKSGILEQLAQARSAGATNRQRIKEEVFLGFEIPLPPLGEQRRIAEILDSIQTQALQLERKIECLDMIMQSAVEGLVSDSSSDLVIVDDVAEVSGGLALGKRDSKPVQAPYLRVANVFRNRLELDEIKILRATDKELERTGLKAGDILIVEAHGNAAEVGRAAVLTEDLTGYTFQNHLFRARVRDDSIDPALLCRILNSHFVRQQMAKRVSTTSGLKTTSISKIRSLKIPLPSSEVQRSFAAVLEVHSQLMDLNNDRRQRIQELQKSLSIRAFQGEL